MTQQTHHSYLRLSRHLIGATVFGLLGLVAAEFFPSPVYAFVALALYLWVLAAVYQYNALLLIVALPILTFKLTEFVSFVAIENGAYMRESMRFGKATAGSLRYLLVTLVFLCGVNLGLGMGHDKKFRHTLQIGSWQLSMMQTAAISIAIAIVVFIYLNVVFVGMSEGFPVLIGVERFYYWSRVSNSFARVFINFHAAIAFLVGSSLLFSTTLCKMGRLTVVASALAVTHLILMLLFGFKQTAFSLSLTLMAVPILAGAVIRDRKPPLLKFAVGMTAVLVISVATALLSYTGSSFDERLTRLSERVALQGQLWHLADLTALSEPLARRTALGAEILEWGSLSFRPAYDVGFEFGLYRVMQDFAAQDLLFYFVRDQIGFIFALFPAWLVAYGYLVMSFLVLGTGLVWGVTFRLVFYAWRNRAYLILPPLALALTMQAAAHIDGMSYRIFGLQIWILLAISALGIFFSSQQVRIRSQ